jgi:hypothetical protein
MELKAVDEVLQRFGFDTTAEKSQFQQNEEMASILVTFLMSEVDSLNKRVAELEAKANA